jgi:carbon monoxide dehydrogenase subunit G
MEMQASRPLAVAQQQAWNALNDPAVLKVCIPGCERLEPNGDNQYAVGVAVKIGPMSAKFVGKVLLSDIHAPNSYRISFDGQGGAAGFGKGQADVQLAPAAEGSGCVLSYTVRAHVGGKMAQMGQRLIDGVAKSMAEDFFSRFDAEMQRRHPQAYEAAAQVAAAELAQAQAAADAAQAGAAGPKAGGWLSSVPVRTWVLGAALVVAAGVYLLG